MKQGSAADKVPFTKINTNKILFQVDKKLYKNINDFGCRFMSMIAIPQIVTGKTLSAENIKYIYDQAVAGNLGEKVMNETCTCGSNEHKLMNLAFDLLGDKDHFCRQIFVSDAAGKYRSEDMLPSKDNLLFIIVDFNTTSNKATFGGHHFVLFNSIGELIYDPAGGTVKSWVNMNRWLVYKVYSRSEQNALVSGKTTKPKQNTSPAPKAEPVKAPVNPVPNKPQVRRQKVQVGNDPYNFTYVEVTNVPNDYNIDRSTDGITNFTNKSISADLRASALAAIRGE